ISRGVTFFAGMRASDAASRSATVTLYSPVADRNSVIATPILPPPTSMTFFIAIPLKRHRPNAADCGRSVWRPGGGEAPELAFATGESQGSPAIRRTKPMRDSDARLLALLRANAREPTASLARKLNLARSTVQERIARLEREGTIKGYTVRLADEADE